MTDETPDVVSRARAALDGITPGPWEADGREVSQHWSRPEPWAQIVSTDVACMSYCYGGSAQGVVNEADAAFIAAAPDLVRDLLAEVERLRRQPVELSASMLADAVKAEAERDELRAQVERLMGVKPDPKHPLEIRHGWLVEAGYEGDVVPGYGMLPDTDALPLLLLSDKPGWPDVGTARKWAEWFAAERDEARAAVERVRKLAEHWRAADSWHGNAYADDVLRALDREVDRG